MPILEGGPHDGAELNADPRYEFVIITCYSHGDTDGASPHAVYRQAAGRMVYQHEASLVAMGLMTAEEANKSIEGASNA